MAKLWSIIIVLLICLPIRIDAQDGCAGSLPPRLTVGQQAQVTPGAANRVRAEPSLDAEQIGEIPGGERFTIVAGYTCADGFTWWQVDYNGVIGWTVESGNNTYWTTPYFPTLDLINTPIQADNLAELTALRIIPLEQGGIYHMALRPNSDQVAISRFGVVDIYDLGTGDHQGEIIYGDGNGWISNIAFSPDGALLVMNDFSEMPEVWDIDNNTLVATLEDYPRDFTMSPLEPLLVSFNTSSFTFWDVETGDERLNIAGSDSDLDIFDSTWRDEVEIMRFSPNGRLVATGFAGGYATVVDVEQEEIVAVLPHTTASASDPLDIFSVSGIAFSPDSSTLATIACLHHPVISRTSCEEAELILWDTTTFEPLNTIAITPVSDMVGAEFNHHSQLLYSLDGALLFVGGQNLWVLDATTGDLLFSRNEFVVNPIRHFAFRANGAQLVTISHNAVSVLGIP